MAPTAITDLPNTGCLDCSYNRPTSPSVPHSLLDHRILVHTAYVYRFDISTRSNADLGWQSLATRRCLQGYPLSKYNSLVDTYHKQPLATFNQSFTGKVLLNYGTITTTNSAGWCAPLPAPECEQYTPTFEVVANVFRMSNDNDTVSIYRQRQVMIWLFSVPLTDIERDGEVSWL